MTRLRLGQLAQSGAADGQSAIYNATTGRWEPGTPASALTLHKSATWNLASAGNDTLTLSQTPYEKSLQIFKNGLLLHPGADYTVSGAVVTFVAALASGDVISDHYWTTVASPADSVLTTSTFSPDSIAGLYLWLRADTISGVASGASLASWADSSSAANNATQAMTANQPAYVTSVVNGLPVVRFNGSTDFMASPASASQLPVTLFAVLKAAGASSTRTMHGASARGGLQWRLEPAGNQKFVQEVVADIATSTSAVGTSAFSVIAASLSSTTYAFYLNGAADGSGTASATLNSGSTINVGRNGTDNTEFFNGDIAEMLVYNSVLSNTDRANVTSYLGSKYGITVV